MSTTPTLGRLAVHSGHWISQTAGVNKRYCTLSTPIPAIWQALYYLSYHMLSGWRPVFPLGGTWSAGASKNPQVRPFAKKSSYGSFLKPLMGYWQSITQHWTRPVMKMTWKWRGQWRKGNCKEWPRSTTILRCRRAADTYVLYRMTPALKTCK